MADLGNIGINTVPYESNILDVNFTWSAAFNPTSSVCMDSSYRPEPDKELWVTIAGITKDDTGTPAGFRLNLIRRDTGAFLKRIQSDNSTGVFSTTLPLTVSDKVQVICLDDDGGVLYNDLVFVVNPV